MVAQKREKTVINTELEPLHLQAIDLKLSGVPVAEIAEAVGRSYYTIRNWFYEAGPVREEWERLRQERIAHAQDIIIGSAPRAAERIRELMETEGTVALGAAKDTLDRAGLKPTERLEHSGSVILQTGPIPEDAPGWMRGESESES